MEAVGSLETSVNTWESVQKIECWSQLCNIPASCSGGTGFRSRAGEILPWLQPFMFPFSVPAFRYEDSDWDQAMTTCFLTIYWSPCVSMMCTRMFCRPQFPRGLRHKLSSLARTQDMNFCVYVVLCVGSGLVTGWSPVQGVKKITKLKQKPGPNKGL
jgi:hypothetical protein